ncbi:MAG: DUF1320 domain-containing protein [Deltaproteobacteria bacterium]|nr:DUF1320 domain-containing protein [Deltaproteobacteria bacterium]
MAYCTQDDLLEQIDVATLIQLTDDDKTGSVDESVITRACADADAEIDSYCGKRYSVPFTTVPPIVRKMAVDITIYNIYGRRRGAPNNREKRYDDQIRLLKDVARGLVSLGENDPDSTPASANTPHITSNPRIFSRTSLEGF